MVSLPRFTSVCLGFFFFLSCLSLELTVEFPSEEAPERGGRMRLLYKFNPRLSEFSKSFSLEEETLPLPLEKEIFEEGIKSIEGVKLEQYQYDSKNRIIQADIWFADREAFALIAGSSLAQEISLSASRFLFRLKAEKTFSNDEYWDILKSDFNDKEKKLLDSIFRDQTLTLRFRAPSPFKEQGPLPGGGEIDGSDFLQQIPLFDLITGQRKIDIDLEW